MLQFPKHSPDNSIMYKYKESLHPKLTKKTNYWQNWAVFIAVTVIYIVWYHI